MVGILDAEPSKRRLGWWESHHSFLQHSLLAGGDSNCLYDLLISRVGQSDFVVAWRNFVSPGNLEVRGWTYVLAVNEDPGASRLDFSLQASRICCKTNQR